MVDKQKLGNKRKFVVTLDRKSENDTFAHHYINLNAKRDIDYHKLSNDLTPRLKSFLASTMIEKGAIKVDIVLLAFIKSESRGEIKQFDLKSKLYTILNSSQVSGKITSMLNNIKLDIENTNEGASDWEFIHGIKLWINTAKYSPNSGKCGGVKPDWIASKSLITVKNKDNRCFLWAVLSCLYHDTIENNHGRWSHYKKYLPFIKFKDNKEWCGDDSKKILDFTGINFPVSVKSYKLFTKLNNININVTYIEDDRSQDLIPIYEPKKCLKNMLIYCYTVTTIFGLKTCPHYFLVTGLMMAISCISATGVQVDSQLKS